MLGTSILTACSKNNNDSADTSAPTEDNTPDGGNTPDTPDKCAHAQTEIKNSKEPTCVKEGYTGDKVCSLCGVVVEKGEEISTIGHNYTSPSVTKQATCVETGVLTYTCDKCFGTKTEIIPLSDTCDNEYHYESDSNHKVVCKNCHKSENGAHVQGELIEETAATCTSAAYKIYNCTECGENYKVYEGEPAEHNWSDKTVVPATCKNYGEEYSVCLSCGNYQYHVVLEKTTIHNYTTGSKTEATCTSEGSETLICVDCGNIKEKTLPIAPHKYGEAETTDDGWTRQSCTVCTHEISSFDAKNVKEAIVDTSKIDGDKAFKIQLDGADIEFPASVVAEMKYNDSVNISAAEADKNSINTDSADEDQKAALENENTKIYDFGVEGIYTGYFGDYVTITLPYTLGEDEDPEGIVIWYISDSGELVEVEDVLFVDEDGDGEGQVVFKVEHFSYYAMAYCETAEMKCRRGYHDMVTVETVKPECEYHGYTTYRCKHCAYSETRDLQIPTGHKWGEKQQPDVSCTNGGYVYSECQNEGCYHIKTYEWVPSLGHKPTGHATCTTGVTCETCNRVIVEAYGHKWSVWTVIIEAGNNKEGLKRRNCPICGATEDAVIAPKSSIQPWEYDSVAELYEQMVEEFFNIKTNGKLHIGIPTGKRVNEISVIINKLNKSYLLSIGGNLVIDNVYYRDGIFGIPSSDGKYRIMNTEAGTGMSTEELKNEIRLMTAQMDKYAVDVFKTVELLADILGETSAESLDKMFAAEGLDFTTQKLIDATEAIQTLYVYLCVKLGTETEVKLPHEISDGAVKKALAAFMKEETTADGTKYSLDTSEYFSALKTLINWANDNQNKSIGEVIYLVAGDGIKAINPELSDISKLISHLKAKYHGNLKVSDLVGNLTSAVEASGNIRMADVYNALNALIRSLSGSATDIEEMIKQSGDMTLNNIAAKIMGSQNATMEQIWDSILELLTTKTLGEVVISSSRSTNPDTGETYETKVTVSDVIEKIKGMLDSLSIGGKFTLTLDKDGKIVDIDIDQTLTASTNGESSSFKYVLRFEQDNSAIITLPSDIAELMNTEVKFTYDNEGNIVISNIPEGFDIDFSTEGRVHAILSDMVDYEKTLSDKFGYDVYVLKKEHWTRRLYEEDLVMDEDGNFYKCDAIYSWEQMIVSKKIAYKDIVNNLEICLPGDDDRVVGYYEPQGTEESYPVYSTVLGYAYRDSNGEWIIFNSDHFSTSVYGDGTVKVIFYRVDNCVHFSDIEPQIRTINSTNYKFENFYGKYAGISPLRITLEVKNEEMNLELTGMFYGGELYFVASDCVTSVFVPTEKLTAVNNKYIDTYKNYFADAVVNEKGEHLKGYKAVRLYSLIPTYYAYYDGYYFDLSNGENVYVYDESDSYSFVGIPFARVDVSGYEPHTLPDGRVIYTVYNKGDVSRYAVMYGYIHVGDGQYVQAYVRYEEGQVAELVYKNSFDTTNNYSYGSANKDKWFSGDDLNHIADRYIKKGEGNTYILSAEGVKMLKALCTHPGDHVSLVLSGENSTAKLKYAFEINRIDHELTSSGNIEDINWGEFERFEFPRLSYAKVRYNNDGSVTFVSTNGETINIFFSGYGEFDIDEAIMRDEEKSEEYGTDVYYVADKHYETTRVALYKGSYYWAVYKRIINEYKDYLNAGSLFASNFTIENMSYKYYLDGNGGSISPIYQATIRLNQDAADLVGGYIDVYVQYSENGELMVLTGVTGDTDTEIYYEGLKPIDEYILSLTYVKSYDGETTQAITESGQKDVFAVQYAVYDGDRHLGYITVPYIFENGRAVIIYTTSSEYKVVPTMEKISSAQLGNIYSWATEIYTETYGDKIYTVYAGERSVISHYRYYVKVAGQYIDLNFCGTRYDKDYYVKEFTDINGITVLTDEGENDFIAKVGDGLYAYGYMSGDEFRPYENTYIDVWWGMVENKLNLDRYIKYGNGTATVSAEILKVLKPYGNVLSVNIHTEAGNNYLSYSDFESLFS